MNIGGWFGYDIGQVHLNLTISLFRPFRTNWDDCIASGEGLIW